MAQEEIPYTKLAAGNRKFCTCRNALLVMLIPILALIAGLFLFVGIGASCCFPLHASCDVSWTVDVTCDSVESALVDQINKWHSRDNCGTGQKCLYNLTGRTSTKLSATHTTPKAGYVDDLNFLFTESGSSCNIKGTSSSETWYAVLDKGTNYCNLHNLITGAGLDKVAGYSETTNNKQCTQYSSANCEIY